MIANFHNFSSHALFIPLSKTDTNYIDFTAYQVDYAFALRYPNWPDEAAEWITRDRAGLDKVTVCNIASRGCYLVHKPCGKNMQAYTEYFNLILT